MMKNKTIVITGASDGIGKEAAKSLVATGENVIIVGRSLNKTVTLAKELNVKYYICDFIKLNNVRELAKRLNNDLDRIDVLVNNAGAVMSDKELTVDGYESTLQVNHLAPFLLTNLLMDKLIRSDASIINTSSVASRLLSKFNINDLNLESGYSPTRAYGNSKLANILFTEELNRRFNKVGIKSACFHPGNVATHFSMESKSLFMKIIYRTPLRRLLISPEQGAKTMIWLTENKEKWTSGGYYEKCKPVKAPKIANDPEIARALWEKSSIMTNLE